MVDVMKELLAHQYEAALCTLGKCIQACPAASWEAPVANIKFCQVAFHTLFFTDYYLGKNHEAMKDQAFHHNRPEFFRDYEEMQPRPQVLLYPREEVLEYLAFCRDKARETLAEETVEVMAAPCGFPRKTFSRAELHVYNLRHIQHHAAQLSLRLRLDTGVDIPWVGSGWRDD